MKEMTTKTNARPDTKGRERVTAYVEPELAKLLRVRAAQDHVSAGSLLRAALIDLLGAKGFAK